MNESELKKRLPELKDINDKKLREEVIRILRVHAPKEFWTKPASSTGKYHPMQNTKEHGLWIHTRTTITVWKRIAASLKAQSLINEKMIDFGIAALLLHDLFKYGRKGSNNKHTVKDHGVLAKNFMINRADLPKPVLDAIETHMGPWSKGRSPETPFERGVHMADMIASTRNIVFRLKDQHPQLAKVMEDVTKKIYMDQQKRIEDS